MLYHFDTFIGGSDFFSSRKTGTVQPNMEEETSGVKLLKSCGNEDGSFLGNVIVGSCNECPVQSESISIQSFLAAIAAL